MRTLFASLFLLVCSAASWGQGAGLPSTLGWFQIPNTQLNSVAPTYPEIQGVGTTDGFASWSSCTVDNRRNMLLCHIGGHTDYFGNEIYGFDLNANPIKWTLLKDASHGSQISNLNSSPEAFTDGSPNARHTYDGLIHFPSQDRLLLFGAFKSINGFSSNVAWLFNPASGVASGGTGWTQAGNTGPNNAGNGSIPALAYDPTNDVAYEVEDNAPAFWKFDPSSATPWSLLTGTMPACNSNSSLSAAIDPVDHLYFCAGNGNSGPAFWKISLNSPFTATNITNASGCSPIGAAVGPGLTWYPTRKTLVAWVGGNSVIEYNPATNSCTTDTFSGGPPSPPHNDPLGNAYPAGSPQHNGTFGMFQYMPGTCGFLIVNDNGLNVWHLRLDTPSTCALNDYNNRVAAAGVLTSQNFDSANTFNQVTSGEGCFISLPTPNPVPTHPLCERETTIVRSGASSMRFVVPGKSDDRPDGWYVKGLGLNLANGQTIYVSYSQRMDAGYMLPMPTAGGGTPTYLKNHIMAWWDGVNNLQSCANPDWVTVNPFNRGWPSTYMQCGSDTIQHNFGGVPFDQWDHNKVSGSTLFDQGFDCPFNAVDQTPCFRYPADVWVTYLYKLQLGHYGTADSTLSAWVSTPTSPAWRQFMYEPNHTVIQDPGLSLNMIQLLPYWTGRDGTVDSGATGTTYYDELITSTQPIQPPLAPPVVTPVGPQADIYLAQAAAGAADGTSCANAEAASLFNSSANWGTGLTQIGSGSTVHFCASISTVLSVPTSQGTGTITLKFETGAKLSQAAGTRFIVLDGSANSWVIDGGTPCGNTPAGHVACNGQIRNTAMGSNLANQVNGTTKILGISAASVSGSVLIKNIEIGPLYLHVPPVTVTSCTSNGSAQVTCATSGTAGFVTGETNVDLGTCPVQNACPSSNAAYNVTGLTVASTSGSTLVLTYPTTIAAGSGVGGLVGEANPCNTCVNGYLANPQLGNLTLQDSEIHDTSWAFEPTPTVAGSGITIEVARVNFFNNDHQIGIGTSIGTPNSFKVKWHDNWMHDYTAWDTVSNNYHHDGLHLFTNQNDSCWVVYNNKFTGPFTGNTTAPIFLQNSQACWTEFNDVFVIDATSTQVPSALWGDGGSGGGVNQTIYNITVKQTGIAGSPNVTNSADVSIQLAGGATTGNNTFLNNAAMDGTTLLKSSGVTYAANAATTGLDFNGYCNYVANGNFAFQWNGTNTNIFATWQGLSGEGTHSFLNASCNEDANGAPQVGSPLITHGSNLTSLCVGDLAALCSDTSAGNTRTPVARPASAAWDIGAFAFTGGSPANVLTPSPLTFTNVLVGTPSVLTVTVSNPGSATLVFNTPFFTITGSNAGDFSRTGGTCVNGGSVLVAGNCTIQITFLPSLGGTRSATLNVNGTASASDALSGFGLVNILSGPTTLSGTTSIKVNP